MGKSFNIEDYGASPEKKINTSGIQKAIDDCHNAGGGKVVCGPGNFSTGTIELKSNVELYLGRGCKIQASENLDEYDDFNARGVNSDSAPEGSTKHLIRAVEADNIAISGPGEICGSGLAFYSSEDIELRKKPATPRPRMIMFYRCANVSLRDASFVDSPLWTVWLMKCKDVFVRGLKISGDKRLINNDGIDIDSCSHVTVSDCVFKTEDDCLVLRSMGKFYDEPCVCENVAVSNCVFETACNGIRIGCPGDSVIRGGSFTNIIIKSSGSGISFDNPKHYLRGGREGTADIYDMVFSNFTVESRRFPLRISIDENIKLKRLSDIRFTGFRIRSGLPCVVQGSPETQIRNVSFANGDIETSGKDGILCRNCSGVGFTDINIKNKDVAGNPTMPGT